MTEDERLAWVKRLAERLERRYSRYALAYAIAIDANVELVINERLHGESDTPENRASKEAKLVERLDSLEDHAKIRAFGRRLDRAALDLSTAKRKRRRKPKKRDL